MEDGPNIEVLARLAHLDLAGPAYTAAVLKYPKHNIALRHRARSSSIAKASRRDRWSA